MRDTRWVHRPRADWDAYKKRADEKNIAGRIYQGLQKLIELRKTHSAFSNGHVQVIHTGNPHVLGFVKESKQERIIVFANFSEFGQALSSDVAHSCGVSPKSKNLLGRHTWNNESLALAPMDFCVIKTIL
jgi:glycosidase